VQTVEPHLTESEFHRRCIRRRGGLAKAPQPLQGTAGDVEESAAALVPERCEIDESGRLRIEPHALSGATPQECEHARVAEAAEFSLDAPGFPGHEVGDARELLRIHLVGQHLARTAHGAEARDEPAAAAAADLRQLAPRSGPHRFRPEAVPNRRCRVCVHRLRMIV
jgi:hypothetical protein